MTHTGQLRERVTIQEQPSAADGGGGFGADGPWTAISTTPNVWARVEPLKGMEQLEAMRLETQVSHAVTIRHRSDVTTTNRLLWGSIELDIEAITNPDERKKFLRLLVQQRG